MNKSSFNGRVKQVSAVILGILMLLGAAWAIDERYATREVTELWLSDMQKQMIQIQKNQQVGAAQQQLWYWQQKVEELTGYCARNPTDQAARARLNDAKRQRDFWQRETHKLLNQ
jgi:TolA-binding protein